MARCNCSPMCEKCCCGPCDCTCAAEQAKPDDEMNHPCLVTKEGAEACPWYKQYMNLKRWAEGVMNDGRLLPVAEQAQAGELPKRKESSDLAREQRERYLNSPEGLQWRQTVALERLAEKTTEQAEVLYGDDVKESGPWIRFSDHLAELAALRSRLAGGVTVDDAAIHRAADAYATSLAERYGEGDGDIVAMRAAVAALVAK